MALDDGLRSPNGVASIAAIFRLTDVSDGPMKMTGSEGSQDAPILAANAREVGRSPSTRRPSTRSSHFPTRVNSIGAAGSGAATSTTKTPAPVSGSGRPQTTGPSGRRPMARRSPDAVRSGFI